MIYFIYLFLWWPSMHTDPNLNGPLVQLCGLGQTLKRIPVCAPRGKAQQGAREASTGAAVPGSHDRGVQPRQGVPQAQVAARAPLQNEGRPESTQ